MGKKGLEPLRLAAHDPKSCLSANSSTSPRAGIISERVMDVNFQSRLEAIVNKKLIFRLSIVSA